MTDDCFSRCFRFSSVCWVRVYCVLDAYVNCGITSVGMAAPGRTVEVRPSTLIAQSISYNFAHICHI